MHGFTDSGRIHSRKWLPALQARLEPPRSPASAWSSSRRRRVTISCFGEPRPKENAWHDYFTDHGGSEGHPEIEEEINESHLEWTRGQVHKALDAEAAKLNGDTSRIALIGESQGSCCALDAALTYRKRLRGVFCSIGQLYSVTPVPPDRKSLPIVTFNGASDKCIAASLSLTTYARLLSAGYDRMRMHVQPLLDHKGGTGEEAALLVETIKEWGLVRLTDIRSNKAATTTAVVYVGDEEQGVGEEPTSPSRQLSGKNKGGKGGGAATGSEGGRRARAVRVVAAPRIRRARRRRLVARRRRRARRRSRRRQRAAETVVQSDLAVRAVAARKEERAAGRAVRTRRRLSASARTGQTPPRAEKTRE